MNTTTTDDELAGETSRRTMMRQLLGVAAGATVAAVALDSGNASAQTGAMQYGLPNNSGIDSTSLLATVAGGRTLSVTNFAANGYCIGGEAHTVYGGHGTAFGMNMTSDDTAVQVHGGQVGLRATSVGWTAVIATSEQDVGAYAFGPRGDVILGGNLQPPQTRSGVFTHGSILRDQNGDIWACIVGGSPGTWRKLAGPGAAGSLHPIEPTRVYDSRWASGGGPLASGSSRAIDISAGRNLASGAIETANVVPATATAVQYTITVANTVGSGFVAVTSTAASTYKASSINWSGSGQIMANSTMAKISAPQLRLWGGGGGSTDVIIDVIGYYL
jgi:hypothetical protein